MRIGVEALRTVVITIFEAAGCGEDETRRVAASLIGANLAGHDSHGVVRTQRYVQWIRDGTMVLDAALTVVVDGPSFAVVDGNYGIGSTVGPQACRLGMAKAADQGVAVIGLRHAGHLGRIGEFAEMAAAANQVSIHLVSVASSSIVAPFGAVERRMGTNPVAIGMPLADRPPVILDFATSVVAEGKALVAFDGGKSLPPDAIISEDGVISGDPSVLYGERIPGVAPRVHHRAGALRAVGDHKGSGLAMMCELIAGALIGSGTAGPPPQRFGNGMLSVYLSLEHFDPDDAIMADVMRYVDWFKSARPADEGGEVLVPGEPERRRRAERLSAGIDLPAASWESILEAAETVGVTRDEIRRLIA